MDTEKQLGIIFIINYPLTDTSNILEDDKIKIFLENLDGGYFNYSSYIYSSQADIYFITCLPGKEENPKSPNTKVIKLEWDGHKYIAGKDVNFGAVNLGNKDVLSAILTYVVCTAEAKDYVLFLFNHSSNFGLGRAVADQDSATGRSHLSIVRTQKNFVFGSETQSAQLFNILQTQKLTISKSFATENNTVISNKVEKVEVEEFADDYKDDMLTNSELSVALLRAFQINNGGTPKRIKIIFSAGCYFQNIDTAYALKDIADYLVGAEGIMPSKSFDYPAIVNNLLTEVNTNGTNIDYEKIACTTIKDFAKPYIDDGDDRLVETLDYCCVSSLNTNYVEELKDNFNSFLQYFISDRKLIIRMSKVRNKLKDLSRIYPFNDRKQLPLYIFDMKYFIEQLCTDKTIYPTHPAYNDYTKLLTTLEKVIEKPVYLSKETRMNNCSGLSLYFPVSFEKAIETYNFSTFYSPFSDMQSFFATASYWPDFLLYYFKFLKLNKHKSIRSKSIKVINE
jgi:hypothetical protein